MQFVSPLSKDYQIIAVISQTLQHLKEIVLGRKLHLFRKRTLKTKSLHLNSIFQMFSVPQLTQYTVVHCLLYSQIQT